MNVHGVLLKPSRQLHLLLVVKWLAFCVEALFLFSLVVDAYLYPFMPPPWGKLPTEAREAAFSAAAAILSGSIAIKLSKDGRWSFLGLLRTIPCVVFLTVCLVVAPQVIAEWFRLRQHR